MPLIKTSNPALNQKIFTDGEHVSPDEAMTLDGTVNKTWILLFCVGASASYPWRVFSQTHSAAAVQPIVMLGAFGGFIMAMLTIYKKSWAPITAPIYALLEGLALGGISALFEVRYPGIAIQSVALTLVTLFVLLMAYRSGLIPVTQKLRLGIVAATGAICLLYVGEMILVSSASTSPPSTAPASSASDSASPSSSWLRSISSSISTSSRAAYPPTRRSTWSGTAHSA
jgi:uncharacterized YccA/Bax inhibitor family protein